MKGQEKEQIMSSYSAGTSGDRFSRPSFESKLCAVKNEIPPCTVQCRLGSLAFFFTRAKTLT
jgi:hypothetical protein